MTKAELNLPHDPGAALALLQESSRSQPVIVFKRSPTCPISLAAEQEFETWLSELPATQALAYSTVDVLAERELARGLTGLLGIRHESPQALCFQGGELAWHASHQVLTRDFFARGLEP